MSRYASNRVSGRALERKACAHYCQTVNQANILFWLSVTTATIGFLLLCYLMMSSHIADLKLLLRAFPAAAVEALAGLLFRQAGNARERATALYDKLRMDQWKADATILADLIADATMRDALKAQLALQMIRPTPATEFKTELQGGTDEKPKLEHPTRFSRTTRLSP